MAGLRNKLSKQLAQQLCRYGKPIQNHACPNKQMHKPLMQLRVYGNSSSAESQLISERRWQLAAAALVGLLGGGLTMHRAQDSLYAGTHCDAPPKAAPATKTYTKDEIAKHNRKETGIWVTYKDEVFDITDFVENHPGGAGRIMLAAGGPVDPFWAMYAQHQTAEVRELLQEYKIGKLEGAGKPSAAATAAADPYAGDPARHSAIIARSAKPFNGETPKALISDRLITPNELFYVRNHLPVPPIDPAKYGLRIEGEGVRTVELSLEDLKTKFKKHAVAATLQCSGNRRHEMKDVKPVKGLDWDTGAISTAVWGGARLSDVLAYAGLDLRDVGAGEVQHVQFEGLDVDMSAEAYAASIPAEKAVDPRADVLLAYEMNGSELPADHGYPVRAVAPGVTGARSVKWLGRIIVSPEESPSQWQQFDYKSFSPGTDWDSVDWGSAPALQETPVTSAISEPAAGEKIDGDEVKVKGYAFSGGGRDVIRVDVSIDGGKSWVVADLKKLPQKRGRAWAWSMFQVEVPIPKQHKGPLELVCKATDDSYNSQPDTVAPIWNLRGVVNNAWHRVSVERA